MLKKYITAIALCFGATVTASQNARRWETSPLKKIQEPVCKQVLPLDPELQELVDEDIDWAVWMIWLGWSDSFPKCFILIPSSMKIFFENYNGIEQLVVKFSFKNMTNGSSRLFLFIEGSARCRECANLPISKSLKQRLPVSEGFIDGVFPLCGSEAPITEEKDPFLKYRTSELTDQLQQAFKHRLESHSFISGENHQIDKFREV